MLLSREKRWKYKKTSHKNKQEYRKIELRLSKCKVRSWSFKDVESIVYYADNRNIWINLRDGFPHPYLYKDGETFIKMAKARKPESFFAIEVNGKAVGSIGFTLHDDVERVSAEIGYWLGEEFWGQGIATEALKAVTKYAVKRHNLTRVYAVPFEWNPASGRVLEKAGYVLEGRTRRSAIKDGKIIDQLLYAYVIPE